MQNKYDRPRAMRRDINTNAGTFRGGKLVPVAAVPFQPSESGFIRQRLSFELDPMPGRVQTPITLEAHVVMVPALAIDVLKNPEDATAGIPEIFRQKMLAGDVFNLEADNEIAAECNIVPVMIAGEAKVREDVRLAYVAAVNYLRRKLYVNAAQLPNTTATIQPCNLNETILNRMAGVLNPEDRVNGLVKLGLPDAELIVRGIGVDGAPNYTASAAARQGDRIAAMSNPHFSSADDVILIQGRVPTSGESVYPSIVTDIYAEFAGMQSEGVSLVDFYNAQKMDTIVRGFRQIIDQNPEHGEAIVARLASGLGIETGKQPYTMFSTRRVFGMAIDTAMDQAGMEAAFRQTNMGLNFDIDLMVPATEFGGVAMVLVAMKPDETIYNQPHPVFSEPYKARNYPADELALDPVPVTLRQLSSDVATGEEDTVAFYTANNGLLRSYMTYGFNRNTDLEAVATRSALWQLKVPLSVTPESIVYPEDLDHYPFADNGPTAKPCHYMVQTAAAIATPIIFGPTPVEELAAIEDAGIFDEYDGEEGA